MKLAAACALLPLLLASAGAQGLPGKPDGETRITIPAGPVTHSSEEIRLLPKPAGKRSQRKNAAPKRPARKPVSEYKFKGLLRTPAYKFDRKTNPIIKGGRPGKKAPSKAVKKSKIPAMKPAQAPRFADDGAGEGTGGNSAGYDVPDGNAGDGEYGTAGGEVPDGNSGDYGSESDDGKLQFPAGDAPQDEPEE